MRKRTWQTTLAAALIAAAGLAGFVGGAAWAAGYFEDDETAYSAER